MAVGGALSVLIREPGAVTVPAVAGAVVPGRPVVASKLFSWLLFTLPGSLRLFSVLPGGAGVCAKAAPATVRASDVARASVVWCIFLRPRVE